MLGRGDQRALGDLGVLGGIPLDQFTVARPVCELLAHEGLGALLRWRPAVGGGRARRHRERILPRDSLFRLGRRSGGQVSILARPRRAELVSSANTASPPQRRNRGFGSPSAGICNCQARPVSACAGSLLEKPRARSDPRRALPMRAPGPPSVLKRLITKSASREQPTLHQASQKPTMLWATMPAAGSDCGCTGEAAPPRRRRRGRQWCGSCFPQRNPAR